MKLKGLFDSLSEPQEGKTSTQFNRLMIVISVVLAALLLYFTLRDLDWGNFFFTIKNAHYFYLLFSLLLSSTNYFIRALRLRVLLMAVEKPLPVSNVFFANMAGYLGNNILPARAGELVRATYLARQNNISASFALAVGLVERLVDLIALIVFGSIALLSIGGGATVFQSALKGIAGVGLIGLLAIFILPRFGNIIERWIGFLPVLKNEHKLKIAQFFQQFLGGLSSLHTPRRALQFVSLTAAVWLMDAFGTVMLSYILNIPLTLQQAFILLAALGLSSAIPSTPGYVGVYQFVAVVTLAPFGVSKADALAYILIAQVLGYFVIGFWGLASLSRFNQRV